MTDTDLARLAELEQAARLALTTDGAWADMAYALDDIAFDADKALILACDPETVLSLIAEAREAARLREALDAAYADRNLVVQAYAQAMESQDYQVAWGVDPSEPDWPVLYIDTPHGQVSWHIPKAERVYEPSDRTDSFGPVVWDGHTNEDKAQRLRVALTEPAANLRHALQRVAATQTGGLRAAVIDLMYALDGIQLPDKASRAAIQVDADLTDSRPAEKGLTLHHTWRYQGEDGHAKGACCLHGPVR